MSRVQIKIGAGGFGKVLVDGVDWSDKVQGIELVSRAGNGPPLVVLTLAPTEVDVDLEGDAVFVRGVEPRNT